MIPAFDLRIGNWIDVRGKQTCVTGITETNVQVNGFTTTENVEDLHPIPLSDELLKKAGFAERGKTALYDKVSHSGFSYHLHAQKIMIFHTEDNTLCHWLSTKIVFLHQLQNIFYYITGNQISIQL